MVLHYTITDLLLTSPSPSRSQGYLLPYFHRHYWLGLRAAEPRAFRWTDPYAPAPSSSSYQNWGALASSAPEPNNLLGYEFCGVANSSQATDAAWGWSDVRCDNSFIFICMTRREWRALPAWGDCVRQRWALSSLHTNAASLTQGAHCTRSASCAVRTFQL